MYISLIRTVILYAAIIFAVRVMGKRQISQLQTSELVVTMLISDLAVIPMQNTGQPLFSGLLPILVLVILEIFLSVLMLKSNVIRHIICGNPVIIIQNGKILQESMKNLRLSIEELYEQLRQRDIVSINEVAFAIVETNGVLSVIKKAEDDHLRPADLKICPTPTELELTAVSDGKISGQALKISGKSEKWVMDILKKEKTSLEEVFILTVSETDKYTLIKKEKSV